MKRWIVGLVCLLVLLAGCGKEEQQAAQVPEAAEEQVTVNAPSQETWYLKYEAQALPQELEYFRTQCSVGDSLVVAGRAETGEVLMQLTSAGESRMLTLPEEVELVYALCPWKTGFMLLGGSLPWAYQAWNGEVVLTEAPQGKLWLAEYDRQGTLLGVTELRETYAQAEEVCRQMIAVEDGFLLRCDTLLIKIGNDGTELGRLSSEDLGQGRFMGMAAAAEGPVILTASSFYDLNEMEYCLAQLEPETMTASVGPALPLQAVDGFGMDDQGQLLVSAVVEGEELLCQMDPSSGALTEVLAWKTLGIKLSADWIEGSEEGFRFFERGGAELPQLTWVYGVQPERIVLDMAVTGSNRISLLAQKFNQIQNVYRVDVTEYSQSELERLQMEILTGNLPDLYCFCDEGAGGGVCSGGIDLAKIGLDLLPLLEADADYEREDFVTGLMNAMEEDGNLYSLPLAFTVTTFSAPAELIPEPGVTLEELEAALQQAGEGWYPFDGWMEASNLLGLSLSFYTGSYVDRETGTCWFDTPEFADYLTWCKTWTGAASEDYPERVLMKLDLIQDLAQVAGTGERARNRFGTEDFTYVGVPTAEGNGSLFEIAVELGVSSQTAHADGAWEFIRYCLSQQGEASLRGIPVLQVVIEETLDRYLQGEETDGLGQPVLASQADVDRFLQLLDTTTVVGGDDPALAELILEEAEYFFMGDRTAEDAAEIIQNRATLYLVEQYG